MPADETSIIIYPDIPYSTPLSLARKRLRLEGSVLRRTKITIPGMPSASLVANPFSGAFDGGFTSLSLITDSPGQVVSVQVVDDNPRQRTPDVTSIGGYHTYNFINHRAKAANELAIRHEIATRGRGRGKSAHRSPCARRHTSGPFRRAFIEQQDHNPPAAHRKGPRKVVLVRARASREPHPSVLWQSPRPCREWASLGLAFHEDFSQNLRTCKR